MKSTPCISPSFGHGMALLLIRTQKMSKIPIQLIPMNEGKVEVPTFTEDINSDALVPQETGQELKTEKSSKLLKKYFKRYAKIANCKLHC